MLIATWNINSVKARVETALAWIKEAKPDVVCLQEIKCESEAFPSAAFEELGYSASVHGQKTYNGVAILSKRRPDEVRRGLPGDTGDSQARYIEAVIPADWGVVRVASIYLPNGNPPATEKFAYKLAWMDRLTAHAKDLLAHEEVLVLAGDYNVIPSARDAKHPEAWAGDALFLPETRARFRHLLNLGLSDAVRATAPDRPGLYTFWDYQAGAWQKDNGIRIDHLLLSPQAADRLTETRLDRHVRGWEKPSDHVPALVRLS
ncbi:MAG: exodeoxyribonuclease III [Rhizobiales bacterium]|nr:exodeoxyribonuclease III [Hyphomicrobiales bacterium]MBI3672666.1 exodeoxyribonuclease III [Hyphomicrobiales bacterium]